MKKLIFCFDGTWNKLDAKHPTNVVITAESIAPSVTNDKETVAQIIYYDEGVGTSKFERLMGGLFGSGLLKNLDDAYRFLIFNYAPGDEIYVFGFSRGAYSARSFVGLIRNCGILERKYASKTPEAINFYKSRDNQDHHNSDKMNEFRNNFCQNVCVSEEEDYWKKCNIHSYEKGDFPLLQIKYVGVWDTVGSLGIPSSFGFLSSWWNKKYKFHDTCLSSFVESARHAVAIDEKRRTFAPTLWSNFTELNNKSGMAKDDPLAPYQQQWFPGVHGGVGGGGSRRGLSDQALNWVIIGAKKAGLVIDGHKSSRIFELQPDFKDHLENSEPPTFKNFGSWIAYQFMSFLPKKDRKNGPNELYEISKSTIRRWKTPAEDLSDKKEYRPKTLDGVVEEIDSLPITKRIKLPEDSYNTYKVELGDDLYRISEKFYGDDKKAEIIFVVNSDILLDKDELFVGALLRIPNPENITSLETKRVENSSNAIKSSA